jgi:hypothetical protein
MRWVGLRLESVAPPVDWAIRHRVQGGMGLPEYSKPSLVPQFGRRSPPTFRCPLASLARHGLPCGSGVMIRTTAGTPEPKVSVEAAALRSAEGRCVCCRGAHQLPTTRDAGHLSTRWPASFGQTDELDVAPLSQSWPVARWFNVGTA